MKKIVNLMAILCLTVLWNACSDDFNLKNSSSAKSDGKGKISTLSTPVLTCGSVTQTSINITVTAGSLGAPAGFSIQWMTKAAFEANGNSWGVDSLVCKASFSGNANLSSYNLGPNEAVTVNIGDLLFDNGASTQCPGPLNCDSTYVFRAFAHATSSYFRSAFTAYIECSTLPCVSIGPCTYGQGYWKTHGVVPMGNNSNEWPVTELTLGTVQYTDSELLSILNNPANGNGLIILAHQLIATKLNLANGTDDTAIATAVADADALIGNLVAPPVGAGSLAPASTSALATTLMNYNEGATGPGNCE